MLDKKVKSTITEVLRSDAQKNALEFISYLAENETTFEGSGSYWEAKYKGEILCFLWIDGENEIPGPWTIWSDQEPGTWASWDDRPYMDAPVDQHIREVAWANVNLCGDCGGCESRGKRKNVLGKQFDRLCNSTMAFTDPDAAAVDCAKKMIDLRMHDILQKAD